MLPEETRQNREQILRQRLEQHEAWEARSASSGLQHQEMIAQRRDPAVNRSSPLFWRRARPYPREEWRHTNIAAAVVNREARPALGRTSQLHRRAVVDNIAMEIPRAENSSAGPSVPVNQVTPIDESQAGVETLIIHIIVAN